MKNNENFLIFSDIGIPEKELRLFIFKIDQRDLRILIFFVKLCRLLDIFYSIEFTRPCL